MGRGDPGRAADPDQPAFAPYNGGEISPGPTVATDEEILDWVRARRRDGAPPVVHGADGRRTPTSVVDPLTMRVHGLDGLRVVDASVDALRHERQHLRAGDDGRREGRRPDRGRHAAAAGADRVLPCRRGRSDPPNAPGPESLHSAGISAWIASRSTPWSAGTAAPRRRARRLRRTGAPGTRSSSCCRRRSRTAGWTARGR